MVAILIFFLFAVHVSITEKESRGEEGGGEGLKCYMQQT